MNVPTPNFNPEKERVPVGQTCRNSTDRRTVGLPHTLVGKKRSDDAGLQTLNDIYEPISTELAAVESIIRNELSGRTPWVQQLLEHNWIQGGKRIRPVMLLLSGAACGSLQAGHYYAAAAVELIHAATLVHDDVIDKAEFRRHLPTVNSVWGNRVSVLLGDYLFTHAFSVAAKSESLEVIKAIARCSNLVCDGEIRQNASQGNFELSEADYMDMVRDKTGELCSCSCFVGATLSGADAETSEGFRQYGQRLGIAFQIIDDILDLIGSPNKVGKTLGTDLFNQKPTLPILHSLGHSTHSERQRLLSLLRNVPSNAEHILQSLQQTGSLVYAQQVAAKKLDEAQQFVQGLPQCNAAESLKQLVAFILRRSH
jgi:octaprenyl-diphosphate synthase